MSAKLCFKCKARPRWKYGRDRTSSYCHECVRQIQMEYRATQYTSYGYGSPGNLHRMADQYRPREAEAETKTADPMARRSTRKEKEFK